MTETRINPLSARARLKLAARRLFAERGVDGVTTREIVKAAGQKNQGSLNYYFGTKEALVKELVVDGAKLIDERRNAWLDELEASDGLKSVRQITDILVFSATRVSRGGAYREDSYNRFITLLAQSHREMFEDALQNKWNSGYQRCLNHLRVFLADLPATVLSQRFIFLAAYLGSVLSIRERALFGNERTETMWASDETLSHFSHTMSALLEAKYDDHSDQDIEKWRDQLDR